MAEDLTRTSPPAPAGAAPAPSSTTRAARFVSGTVLAARYRIVSLVGAGGMGEVYKADDLRLEHPVALKFLPETLSLSPGALSRFHAEVRIARQVSHPNVCRVYDVGDVDGLNFLTMEFIDGEDLASLLRRIGRLPPDKAVEVARQLCAGLAAAHDAGVVHRDLKPHNVMIDGRGRARITDFGVAALAREVRQKNVVAGTPAYMAPEQLRGEDATVRSDIYSLGLVLYEIFTGKRAIQAGTLAEAVMHHSSGSIVTSPSNVVRDVDPIVERVILRCLERDPAMRPASAIQVAAALPGGDPLQAALAAGETPSPEMVAASGSSDAIRSAVALPVAVATVAVIALVGLAGLRWSIQARSSAETSLDVLAFRARETLTALGYRDRGADSAYGLVRDLPYLNWDRVNRDTGDRITRVADKRPAALQFWFRESPEPLGVLLGFDLGPPVVPDLTLDNPPPTRRGMRYVKLDTKGRLIEFGAVPFENDRPDAAPMTWDLVFRLADLDQKTFTPVAPEWTPPAAMDQRAAWTGTYPEQTDLPIRLEAASYHGRLVALRVTGAWSGMPARTTGSSAAVGGLIFSIFLCGIALAWINTRAGRGDRRGALRVALALFGLSLLSWTLGAHHLALVGELIQVRQALSLAVFSAVSAYVAYLAIEPQVRRRWPVILVGWSRLLAGAWSDPLVGREVLSGFAAAAVLALTMFIRQLIEAGTTDVDVALTTFQSVPRIAAALTQGVQSAIALSLLGTVFVLVVRILARNAVLAGALNVAIAAAFAATSGSLDITIATGLLALNAVIVVSRFGLLAFVACLLMNNWIQLLRGGFAQNTGGGVFVLVLIAATIAAAASVAMGRLTARAR
ncbi:MAG TPA: serine/threonine-protein kinase [Vicinamibacterales bacterium]|nr:serine/threonine-protein kinase [Vicinamibacterales bacterium]